MRILDEVTRDGEDDHPPVGEIVLDRLHTTVLARIEGPEPRHSPALAAAVLIATRGMARDRQPVVASMGRQTKNARRLAADKLVARKGLPRCSARMRSWRPLVPATAEVQPEKSPR
jgi:hypothetical protein